MLGTSNCLLYRLMLIGHIPPAEAEANYCWQLAGGCA